MKSKPNMQDKHLFRSQQRQESSNDGSNTFLSTVPRRKGLQKIVKSIA